MGIDLKFVELTADVLEIFILKYRHPLSHEKRGLEESSSVHFLRDSK